MLVFGWILLAVGGLLGVLGLFGLADAMAQIGNPYAVSGSGLTFYSSMVAVGFGAAHIGFFLVLFGWLGQKVERIGKLAIKPPASPYEELARHASRHDRGEITDEEYEAHRLRILG
ncbi:SHOCT domain-containing protein [Brevundimonas sp. S30B]|uniref:SHOCT domain-containing protein n=1 Tax=unclassified Brevundimonas TaxID=2622653 RepID=UPI001072696A|nr:MULTISPECIES: SHOCT domain-containing protein [unclassified Brevundimonas]QBX38673.1 SHOCT domain-containing protein [Brevundimonas sp. MF30-B]TFW01264.1 SHOCT domain-containing protein [Brevundimonas sp. S30B]